MAYTWRAMQKAFFADASPERSMPPLPSISMPERLGAALLIIASLTIGLYPQLLLNLVIPALNSPFFDGLRKGHWR